MALVEKHNGNKAAAARELGVLPCNFYIRWRKIKEWQDESENV